MEEIYLLKKYNKLNKIINKKILLKIKKEKNKIICITGMSNIEKSIFTILFFKNLQTKNKKIIILDFDIINKNNIKSILKIKEDKQYIKINTNIFLFNNKKYLIQKNINIKQIIEKLKQQYDYIIIQTSSECFFEKTKNLISISDINIFLKNKQSKNLLKMYIKNWKIDKQKLNIIKLKQKTD